ncbi:tetrapyrrole biosynthesis, uroporphyrinogen III synthase [Paraphysoderma sedebokerense]|nr:tetrapyrrole biosynthesis, uroporphyrinogen III synthase [Paraphysoderma sedebokerense]
MSLPPRHTILFKDHPDSSSDPYTTHLTSSNYTPHFIPVISSSLVPNCKKQLKQIIQNRAEEFDGVVVTSHRSAEVWRDVWLDLTVGASLNQGGRVSNELKKSEEKYDNAFISVENQEWKVQWIQKPIFAVGVKTACVVQGLGFNVLGSECGYGENLANFISKWMENGCVDALSSDLSSNLRELKQIDTRVDEGRTSWRPRRKLLFLTGDKTRDVLPQILSANSIALYSVQVYITHRHPDLTSSLSSLLQDVKDNLHWMIFFSPSGVRWVKEDFKIEDPKTGLDGVLKTVKVGCIGETTAGEVRNWMKGCLEEDEIPRRCAVAKKPNAEELVKCMLELDNRYTANKDD